jgi:hypothetical protein
VGYNRNILNAEFGDRGKKRSLPLLKYCASVYVVVLRESMKSLGEDIRIPSGNRTECLSHADRRRCRLASHSVKVT